MVDGLLVGFVANAIIGTAYLAVAVLLGVTAVRTDQWRSNPLGLGTVLLYITCGGGHAVHALQLFEAYRGVGVGAVLASGLEYDDWTSWVWDIVTAGIGIWYWTMRRRFPELVTGAAVFEDLRLRQRRAMEINDNVVQSLARAKLNFEMGRDAAGAQALDETIDAGQRIVDALEAPRHRGAS